MHLVKASVYLALYAVMAAFLLASAAMAQVPVSAWTQALGGACRDAAWCLELTGDGGCLLAGEYQAAATDCVDVLLLRTDAAGDSLWSVLYGGAATDVAYGMAGTPDGGYAILGQTASYGAGSNDLWLLRTDSLGALLWQRTYGGPDDDGAYHICTLEDGGFIIAAWSRDDSLGTSDAWLIRTDAQGEVLWDRRFGGPADDFGFSVLPVPAGGYLFFCTSHSFGQGNGDWWIIRTDAQGDSLWSRTYGTPHRERARDLLPCSDGGFLLLGYGQMEGRPDYDVWLMRTDAQGDSLWARTYGGLGYDEGWCLQEISGGRLLIAGWTQSFGAGLEDAWLVCCDTLGNLDWHYTVGGPGCDFGFKARPTPDGGYLLTGMTHSFGSGDPDVLLARLEPANLRCQLQAAGVPTLPPGGGSVSFTAQVANDGAVGAGFDFWVAVRLPDGSLYGPTMLRTMPGLAAQDSLFRPLVQAVPPAAPAGSYWLIARAGDYPGTVCGADSFLFTKEAGRTASGAGEGSWVCTEDSFPGELGGPSVSRRFMAMPEEVALNVSPNPFNPQTVARYELREASHVRLRVYDTAGRVVATLVDGWKVAGVHEVTFDGTGLASGVYLVRLQAGEASQLQKLVLLK
ncbi:MAG: T9SS C-terminal target domain-containing protein [Candidatus Zixiibacteriota bacterium]|nr:MAG: T9SS C-terminal target domain-containing protein [candidate division Zixibacteria bacterium]